MPARIPKVCRVRGCHNLTTERHGYCFEHAGLAVGWRKTIKCKGSESDRGYGTEWRRLRKIILKRDCYLCQVCQSGGIVTPATEVDHIVNKADGGTDAPSNLQSICSRCHQAKTLAEASRSRQAGVRRG